MAEEIGKNNPTNAEIEAESGEAMATDRGLFDFMKKKDDEQVIASEFQNKVQVSETTTHDVCHNKEDHDNKHHAAALIQNLHPSHTSSSSSSDEEGDDEEKKKKRKEKKEKKGLKDKMKEKLAGGEGHKEEDTNVPIEKCDEDDKKEQGFLDKIKEKLPVGHKKSTPEDVHVAPPAPVVHTTESCTTEDEVKEKRGFLDKIKDKIPGFHSKNDEQEEKKEQVKRETE